MRKLILLERIKNIELEHRRSDEKSCAVTFDLDGYPVCLWCACNASADLVAGLLLVAKARCEKYFDIEMWVDGIGPLDAVIDNFTDNHMNELDQRTLYNEI